MRPEEAAASSCRRFAIRLRFGTLPPWLQHHDVPYAPINRIDDVVDDPQVKHLGLVVPVESPHGASRAVRPAVQFGGERARCVRAAPLLNEHGAAIRADLASGIAWPSIAGAIAADVG